VMHQLFEPRLDQFCERYDVRAGSEQVVEGWFFSLKLILGGVACTPIESILRVKKRGISLK